MAFARLRDAVERACSERLDWSSHVAAAIRATMGFVAANPADGAVLTKEALAYGADNFARYRRVVAYIAALLAAGREESLRGGELPRSLEDALAGGIVMLVAQRVDCGRARELPGIAADAIEFALTPYLGGEAARRIANERGG